MLQAARTVLRGRSEGFRGVITVEGLMIYGSGSNVFTIGGGAAGTMWDPPYEGNYALTKSAIDVSATGGSTLTLQSSQWSACSSTYAPQVRYSGAADSYICYTTPSNVDSAASSIMLRTNVNTTTADVTAVGSNVRLDNFWNVYVTDLGNSKESSKEYRIETAIDSVSLDVMSPAGKIDIYVGNTGSFSPSSININVKDGVHVAPFSGDVHVTGKIRPGRSVNCGISSTSMFCRMYMLYPYQIPGSAYVSADVRKFSLGARNDRSAASAAASTIANLTADITAQNNVLLYSSNYSFRGTGTFNVYLKGTESSDYIALSGIDYSSVIMNITAEPHPRMVRFAGTSNAKGLEINLESTVDVIENAASAFYGVSRMTKFNGSPYLSAAIDWFSARGATALSAHRSMFSGCKNMSGYNACSSSPVYSSWVL